MKEFAFTKMHGAGNDFVLFDDRDETFPLARADWLRALAHRRTGIGCDGFILVQPSASADFRMRFINPDGTEVEMCGNGARCVARFARRIGAAPDSMTMETVAGPVRAELLDGEAVRLHLTDPTDWRMNRRLDLDGKQIEYHYVNSGVPHAVVECGDIGAVDLPALGSSIRYHEDFAPHGTNVDVMEVTGFNALKVRTYERGVEGETLACGTGIVAAALTAGRLNRVQTPVDVECAFGAVLRVDYVADHRGASDVRLTGPAVEVFQGHVAFDPR
jgi:diaminopimelate epimerase